MQAKAEDAFRAGAVGAVKNYAHLALNLAQLGGGDREMIEVVLDIIIGAIERGLPARGGSAQDGHVAGDGRRPPLVEPLQAPYGDCGRFVTNRSTTPLFADAAGEPYTHHFLHSLLRAALAHLYGTAVASLYSFHSFRSGLASVTMKGGWAGAKVASASEEPGCARRTPATSRRYGGERPHTRAGDGHDRSCR